MNLLLSSFEQRDGSMPQLFHPPTPSATDNNYLFTKWESSPPFYILSGWGITFRLRYMQIYKQKYYNFF